jgi:hypothetical protein
VLSFNVLTHPLLSRPLRKLFSTDTNVKPEHTFDGKIIIVDLPVQEFRLAGRIANLVWKYWFQVAVLRRMQPADRQSFLRPVFLWADEAQNFVSRFDAEYQAVARSAGGCTVYLTQNRESFRRVLGDDDAVDSLLGNMQCKSSARIAATPTNGQPSCLANAGFMSPAQTSARTERTIYEVRAATSPAFHAASKGDILWSRLVLPRSSAAARSTAIKCRPSFTTAATYFPRNPEQGGTPALQTPNLQPKINYGCSTQR